MTGSVIDGEDVLQETLVKAIEAFPHTGPLANVEGWLFRIAHNAALDFLRRRARREGVQDATRRWRRSPIPTARSSAARPPPPACAP